MTPEEVARQAVDDAGACCAMLCWGVLCHCCAVVCGWRQKVCSGGAGKSLYPCAQQCASKRLPWGRQKTVHMLQLTRPRHLNPALTFFATPAAAARCHLPPPPQMCTSWVYTANACLGQVERHAAADCCHFDVWRSPLCDACCCCPPPADVHIVGVSSQAAGHGTLVPELVKELRAAGMGHVLVVCGGIIPRQDQPALRAAGVAAFYGPGTRVPAAALDLIGMVLDEPPPLVAGVA